MKKLLYSAVLLMGIVAVTYKMNMTENLEEQNKESVILSEEIIEADLFNIKIQSKADTALLYIQENNFDSEHVILVDFSIHSGKHRFFVWNFNTQSIELSSLCAHGMGNDNYRNTYTDIVFSNVEGSYCSSLGKYKTGVRSYSNWGINVHYKLHGLEDTNSNAFRRIVVLHSHSPIPKTEIYPSHLPLGYSQGCPVVDDETMEQIDALLKSKNKPVLLWIYV